MKIEYLVEISTIVGALEEKVNAHLRNGWSIHMGVVMCQGPDGDIVFAQTLIKITDSEGRPI